MMTSLPNPCVFVGTYTYLPLGPVPLPRPLHPPSPTPPISLPLLRFHSPPNSSSFSPLSLLLPLLIPARSQRHNTHTQQNTQRSNFTYIRKIVCITVRHAFYSPPYIFATAHAILAGKASLSPNLRLFVRSSVCTFVTLVEFASL